MPYPAGTPYSEHPEKRLNAVLEDVFSGSRLALARAAGVSRSLANKWPPGSEILMDRHLLTAIESELRSGIDTILRYITWLLIPTAIGLILSQLYVNKQDVAEAVRRMVAGIVPMVPEGLVLLTSMAFAIGVIRLGRRQCLVQELPAIEGLDARLSASALELLESIFAIAAINQATE